MQMVAWVALALLPIAAWSQSALDEATPQLNTESSPEQVVARYPIGIQTAQGALASHGKPDHVVVLRNGLVGWVYPVSQTGGADTTASYTLVIDPYGRVVDVLYRGDGTTLSALQVRPEDGVTMPGAPNGGWGYPADWMWDHRRDYRSLWGPGYGAGGGWVPWLGFTVLLVAVVALLVVLFRPLRRRGGGSRAMEILNERYARGELEREEFERRRRALRG